MSKELIALHNFNRFKLEDVLDNGYFICPSMAVTTEENCLANAEYGECTVIFKDEVIDPSKNPNALLLSADGYTVVAPYGAYEKPVEDVVADMIEEYNDEENFMYRMGEDICKSSASVPLTWGEAKAEIDRIISMDDYIDYKRNTLVNQYEAFLDKNFKGWDDSDKEKQYVTHTPFTRDNSIAPGVEIAFKAAIKAASKEIDLQDKQRAVRNSCRRYGLKVTAKKVDAIIDYADKMRKAPIVYFEEKLFQAVYNKDIKCMVVPYNLKPELMEQLKESNIPFKTYKSTEEREQVILDACREKEQQLTPAQEEYFKDSKMRTENNELQVFYHATNKKFDSFDKKFIGEGHGSSFGEGFYFSSEPIPAYGENIAVYLDVKQPFVLDLKDMNTVHAFADMNGVERDEINEWIRWYDNVKGGIGKALRENYVEDLQGLKDKGYDGIIVLNTSVGGYGDKQKQEIGKEVIVFEPNQIKSVDNLYPTKSDNFKDNKEEYLKDIQEKYIDIIKDNLDDYDLAPEDTNLQEKIKELASDFAKSDIIDLSLKTVIRENEPIKENKVVTLEDKIKAAHEKKTQKSNENKPKNKEQERE